MLRTEMTMIFINRRMLKRTWIAIERNENTMLFTRNDKCQRESPPFGPKFSSFMTSSREMRSMILIAHSYGKESLAGSRLTITTFLPAAVRNCCIPLQYVDLPLPGGPTTTCPNIYLNLKVYLIWNMNLYHNLNVSFILNLSLFVEREQ